MKTLITKELRENVKWMLPAGILLFIAMVIALGPDIHRGSLVFTNGLGVFSGEFQAVTFIGFSATGLALGFLGLVFESRRGGRALLLHRPLSPNRIFAAKSIAGVASYALATLVPLLFALGISARWTVGPLSASMFLPALVDMAGGLAFYFAGMLVAIRRARWYGSRAIVIVAPALFMSLGFLPSFSAALPVVVLGVGILATAAWGSFVAGGFSRSQPPAGRAALAVCLLLAFCALGICATLGAYFAADEMRVFSRRFQTVQIGGHLGIASDGGVSDGSDAVPVAFVNRFGRYAGVPELDGFRFSSRFVPIAWGIRPWFFDRQRGVILQFDRGADEPFSGYLDLDSMDVSPDPPSRARELVGASSFEWSRRRWGPFGWNGQQVLVFSDAVYEFVGGVRTLFRADPDERVLAAGKSADDEENERFRFGVVLTDRRVVVLRPDGSVRFATPVVPDIENSESIGVAPLDDGKYAVYFARQAYCVLPDGAEEVIRLVSDDGGILEERRLPAASGFIPTEPPYVALGASLVPALAVLDPLLDLDPGPGAGSMTLPFWIAAAVSSLACAAAAVALARRHAFPAERAALWTLLAFTFGLAGLVTLLAFEDWPARVCCASCGRPRVTTRETCERCGSDWEPPKRDGTEVFDAA